MRRRYGAYLVALVVGTIFLGGMILFSQSANAQFPNQLAARDAARVAPPPPPVQAGKPQLIGTNPTGAKALHADRPDSILYSQYDNQGGSGTSSQDFETVNDDADDQAADDFVVPTGQTWNISEVDVAGFYTCITCPVASAISVTFYSNVVSGTYNIPGPVVASRPNMTYTNGPNFATQINPQVTLPPGIYWVSVQAILDFGPGPPARGQQWFWLDRTVQAFSGAAWRNPGGGFGTPCNNWDRRTFCVGDPAAPDQVFAIGGERQGQPTGTPTSVPIPTSTPTPCPLVTQVAGVINASDPTQIGRMGRTGVASTCAVPKTCPGPLAGDTTVRNYDTYTFTNSSGLSQCYTVTLTATGCAGSQIFSEAYLGSYDPTNFCTNYLADAGGSATTTQYSFSVPAGATFVVVVNEITGGAGCAGYTVALNACNALPTPTPTVCPRTLTGHLTYQGLSQPNPGNVQPVTVLLQPTGGGPTRSFTTIPDSSGNFTLNLTSVPAGTYNYWIKSPRYLASAGTLTVSGTCGAAVFDFGTQRAGDINDDNCVDVTDFTLLRASFGKACGDPGFNPNADYNNDCVVDTLDFGLLRSNFGQCGAPQPSR